MITTAEKITALRTQIKANNIDGYMIPKADEYQGEFVAAYAERLKWLTGFTGSAGIAVVTQHKAAVLSDGRYTIQLRQQLDTDIFGTADSVKLGVHGWLDQHELDQSAIGYDPWLFTPAQLAKLKEHLPDLKLIPVEKNLIDEIWKQQPAKPKENIEIFSEKLAGRAHNEKKQIVAEEIARHNAGAAIITLPDSIAWLLNIRGNDTPYIPGVHGYAIINADKTLPIELFMDVDKVTNHIRNHLADDVQIMPFSEIEKRIKALQGDVLLDDKRSPEWFRQQLKAANITMKKAKDPCIEIKAIKTSAEKHAIKQAHIADGVALVKFLYWLENTPEKSPEKTEVGIAEKLEELRSLHPAFKQNSFPTISGFGQNGAIVHYRADEKTNAQIIDGNLLLLDSGGQYYDGQKIAGTTDITRTIAIGQVSKEMRENCTHVLRGHINLARAVFAKDKTGKDVDEFARAPLKQHGLDFAHGTGHGVGCYLAVHEEATSISPRGEDTFKAGMLISNEPGYYKEGAYGIRIENLVLVTNKDEDNFSFETISFAPIDRTLIATELLNEEEKQWLNKYHGQCYTLLSPHLDDHEKNWLKNATAPI